LRRRGLVVSVPLLLAGTLSVAPGDSLLSVLAAESADLFLPRFRQFLKGNVFGYLSLVLLVLRLVVVRGVVSHTEGCGDIRVSSGFCDLLGHRDLSCWG
jgi:hypothetical protein